LKYADSTKYTYNTLLLCLSLIIHSAMSDRQRCAKMKIVLCEFISIA